MELQLARPTKFEFDPETLSESYGRLTAEPFERGYGITLGNALRRVLLSSLPGYAVTKVNIQGAYHEFTSIPCVAEDVTDIVLNLKNLLVRLNVPGPKTIYLHAKGPGEVTAGDITEDPDVRILNPDLHIATLDEGGSLNIEMTVARGRGYVTAEQNRDKNAPIGDIYIDSVFTPVRKVNFSVENTRLGQWTEYDRLILDVWTDKTITPQAAVTQAADILREHFEMFVQRLGEGGEPETPTSQEQADESAVTSEVGAATS